MSPWIRKRDGSRVWAIHNPDGSVFDLDQLDREEAERQAQAKAAVQAFLRQIGRQGGLARARRHSREELAAWGRVRHTTGTTDDGRNEEGSG